jgi:hypothetical protein
MWIWLSFNPGIRRRPPASIVRVWLDRNGCMSRSSPTAINRPSPIATAVASGRRSSSVATWAFVTIMSAVFVAMIRSLACG